MANMGMCFYCFETLEKRFDPKLTVTANKLFKNENYPVFVTWEKGDGELRGCIGTFESKSLYSSLVEYAEASAFRDPRFTPITKEEIPNLQCKVNLLVNFKTADGIYDWEPGTDGVWISFYDSNSKTQRTSTYLPSVTGEWKGSKQSLLESLVVKSGFRGDFEEAKKSMRLVKYQSLQSSCTYAEYKKWKSGRL